MSGSVVIGTRASTLALAQAAEVRRLVSTHFPDRDIVIRTVTTTGDRDRISSLADMGGKGVFVKELEAALLAGEVGCCVHSMKDVPSRLPEGLCIGAVPLREDVHDVLVTRGGLGFADLPTGARLGTGSPRRRVQILDMRDDLEVVGIRGNLETRIAKVMSGELDAVCVAAAGLKRLGRDLEAVSVFAPEDMVPAAGQGAIGLEIRADDADMHAVCIALDDVRLHRDVDVERTVMARLGADCAVPFGAYAHEVSPDGGIVEGHAGAVPPDDEGSERGEDGLHGRGYRIEAFLSDGSGCDMVRVTCEGASDEAATMADAVADELLASGISSDGACDGKAVS